MSNVRLAFAVVLLALLLVVGIQNSGGVHLRFLTWSGEISLVALVFITAGIGLVAGILIAKVGGRRPKGGAR